LRDNQIPSQKIGELKKQLPNCKVYG